jgi:hypothetical protein
MTLNDILTTLPELTTQELAAIMNKTAELMKEASGMESNEIAAHKYNSSGEYLLLASQHAVRAAQLSN